MREGEGMYWDEELDETPCRKRGRQMIFMVLYAFIGSLSVLVMGVLVMAIGLFLGV